MQVFSYKTQFQIVIASMALHNYIRRKSEQDMTFTEFDRHSNCVPHYIFCDVIPCSQKYEGNKPLQMNYIHDGIALSLMEQ